MDGYMTDALVPIGPALVVLLLRKEAVELAGDAWQSFAYDEDLDNWYATFHWALGAEIALRFGDRGLGARLHQRLLPMRGGAIISGTGPAHGPADAYLALAAAAAGESDVAGRHADAAMDLCRTWEIPQVSRWLADLRDRYSF
jgi:hypothetical protein